MEFSQLNYFRTVARTGNISQAARELFVTQPNLSRSIARLEGELGVPLFEHRKGKVVLNEYGRIFLSGVENAFGELNTCIQTVQRLYENNQNILSLGCSIDGFLPDILQPFSRAHPEIGIRQYQGDAPRLAQQLVERTLTLAVTPYPLNHSLLTFRLLGEMDYGLFVHGNHPLAKRSVVELKALAGENLICDASRLDAKTLRSICRARGFEPTLAYEVESTNLVYRLLEQKAGVAVMPVSQMLRLRALFPDSSILVIPLEEGVPPASLGVSYHKGYPLTDAANAFIQFAIDLLVQEKVRMAALGITSKA